MFFRVWTGVTGSRGVQGCPRAVLQCLLSSSGASLLFEVQRQSFSHGPAAENTLTIHEAGKKVARALKHACSLEISGGQGSQAS